MAEGAVDIASAGTEDSVLAVLIAHEAMVIVSHDRRFCSIRKLLPEEGCNQYAEGVERLQLEVPEPDARAFPEEHLPLIEFHYAECQRKQEPFQVITQEWHQVPAIRWEYLTHFRALLITGRCCPLYVPFSGTRCVFRIGADPDKIGGPHLVTHMRFIASAPRRPSLSCLSKGVPRGWTIRKVSPPRRTVRCHRSRRRSSRHQQPVTQCCHDQMRGVCVGSAHGRL